MIEKIDILTKIYYSFLNKKDGMKTIKNKPTQLTRQVIYQEVDYLAEYKLAHLLSLLTDLATLNAIEIEMWNDELKGKYGWILSKQTLRLQRPIKAEETITITTRAKKAGRVQFERTYDIDVDGKTIGGIYSLWTLIDIRQRKITKPQLAGITIPDIEPYDSFLNRYEPVCKDIELTHVLTRQALYNDIDINQHMNNAKYIEWALDLLPYDLHRDYFVEQLSMHFKKEIVPLSLVELFFGQKEDCFKTVFMVNGESCFELSGQLKRRNC